MSGYDAGEFGLRKKHNMVMFSNDFSKGKIYMYILIFYTKILLFITLCLQK